MEKGKCKSKTHYYDTHVAHVAMAIIEKKSIGGDVEKLEPLYPNDENANSRSHSENSMEGPQKIKHTATLRPSLFVQKN